MFALTHAHVAPSKPLRQVKTHDPETTGHGRDQENKHCRYAGDDERAAEEDVEGFNWEKNTAGSGRPQAGAGMEHTQSPTRLQK